MKKVLKKIFKILFSIIAWVIILLIIVYIGYWLLLNEDWITKDDGVASGYFQKVDAKGELEKKYTQMWPYRSKKLTFASEDSAIKNYTIVYPEGIEQSIERFPAIIMVNWTYTPASDYIPLLEHLASWGFIVIGNEDPKSWSGESTSLTLDFLLTLAQDKTSILYDKVDIEHIGINGHSQGWAGAINAITNYENGIYYTSLYTVSPIPRNLAKHNKIAYDPSKIKIPYFMTSGLGIQDRILISTLSTLQDNYNDLPEWTFALMARRKKADHRDMLEYGDAYMTAWFLMTLKSDPLAQKVFIGENAELFNTPNRQDTFIKNASL